MNTYFQTLYSTIDRYYKSGQVKISIEVGAVHNAFHEKFIPTLLAKPIIAPTKFDQAVVDKKAPQQYTLFEIYTVWKSIITSIQAQIGGITMHEAAIINDAFTRIEEGFKSAKKPKIEIVED
jgi:hypothetical protein